MLADRIRAFGIASVSILGILAAIPMLEPHEVIAPRVTVTNVDEPIEPPVREVQYVTPPARQRTVLCRLPIDRFYPHADAAVAR